MKNNIHPEYNEITATCSCGNVIKVGSTVGKDLALDICSACHPFYTGTQRVVDTGGRIEKFKNRFGALGKK
ncbi:MAG: 50S ribosomal protein L31 [Psychromonas sp.]